ncbi:MAG: hypothetical protein DVB25_02390 [Verrucomicrobia bacterium]|nr:MAG: hypothetical protein DVB25_02390 [Verrucomicrobiota bacterium]
MICPPCYCCKHRRQPLGMSLVVVVSLISLLTVLAVSLLTLVTLSRQTRHLESESRKTELLAQAALHGVMADLRDEMEKGSSDTLVNKLTDGTVSRQYDMTKNRSGMRVTAALVDGAPEGGVLIKQSQPDKPFHTWKGAPKARASAVSTASGNEPLPAELWNLPRLLEPGASFSAASAPTWIYVSRDGHNPQAYTAELRPKEKSGVANPQYVIGRYAYNLYNVSGLLDINAAGHPADLPGAQRVGHKGSQVMADLACLPGMPAGAAAGPITWRHAWTAADAALTEDYLRLSEGGGWRRLAANDNVFLSRQDLLDFAKKQPGSLPQEALPFLTHFSRDLNAPSYRPDPARPRIARNAASGGNDAYGADARVNPDLSAFDPKRQRQLLPRRFPLERLKWVVTPTTAKGPDDPDKALRYFGLSWQGTYWKYVHCRSNGDLYTLQEVPTDREADFFEILRATVLAGSLGRQFAAKGWDAIDQQLSMHQLGGVDASVNLNIMELGASIIDQYDSDSNPTCIMLPGSSRPYYAFGKEDVPYLCRTSAIPFRGKPLPAVNVYYDDGKLAPTQAFEASMVLQPMLWRPHQTVKNYNGPTRFRIYPQHVDLGGGSVFYMVSGWNVPGKGGQPGQPNRGNAGDYTYWGGPNYRITNPELFPKTLRGDEYIEIGLPKDSTAFREPQSVHSAAHGAIAGYTISGNAKPIDVRPADLRWGGLPTSFSQVSGFLVGHAVTAEIESSPAASSGNRLGIGYFRGDPIEMLLQYQGPDGTWRPYQRAEFTYKSNWGDHYLCKDPDWKTECFCWSSYLIDPRTDRFGGLATVLASGVKITQWTSLHPQMYWPEGVSLAFGKLRTDGVRPGWTGPAFNIGWNDAAHSAYNWYDPLNPGAVAENNALAWGQNSTFAYKDPDNVMRPGMGALNEYNNRMFLGNPMSKRHAISDTGKLTQNESEAGRPLILNRPFRSVAELAYAFRGTPWRDIDFLNPGSPDAGLLDVFCLYEDPDEAKLTAEELRQRPAPVDAGRVNLNAAGPEVIAALLSGTAREDGNYISATEAASLAKILVNSIRSTSATGGPLLSKAELVSRPSGNAAAGGTASSLITTLSNGFKQAEDRSINDRRQALARALSDGTTVRSWTFTLDLVVQSGQLPPAASSLDAFNAAAERHFWIHFAIDRITGRLLDVQWETVKQ